jgi:uncharacterized caspase-like protein
MGKIRSGLVCTLALLAWTVVWAAAAQAQTRVALVIGNGAYTASSVLSNPVNDAKEIAASLERLGFAVTTANDAGFDKMRRALLDFGRLARRAEIAIVYFAGHGIEVGGENWLMPVDAELKADTDAEHEAIGLKTVLSTVEGASKLGLVILDACRNNPFAATMQRSLRTRSVARGLAPVEPSSNVLVAYAAKEGTTADDGTGRNSPFTLALLKHMETPGLEINFLFRNVRDDVIQATRRAQQPFVYGSLSKDAIYLKGEQAVPSLPAALAPVAAVSADKRVALVIGMNAYQHLAALKNPTNDAAAVANALRQANFASVRVANDLTQEQLTAMLRGFSAEAANADVAVVYFAGHGMRHGDGPDNYVYGIDVKLRSPNDIRSGVALNDLVAAVAGANKLRLVVVDANQTDDFKIGKAPTAIPRVAGLDKPGTLVFYSVGPGQQAADGDAAVSPFAKSFVDRMATPVLELGGLLKAVSDDVAAATKQQQRPVVYGKIPNEKFTFTAAR